MTIAALQEMAQPKVEKVVLNMGIGALKDDKGAIEKVSSELAAIAGQKPALRPARKSVAGFNVRKGEPVGLKVTLRGRRMQAFLQKLFNFVLPRLRDFRGVSKDSFDQNANFTLGISEHAVFPEISLGEIGKVRGLEITIVTNTKDKEKAMKLMEELGMPFMKDTS